MTFRCVAWEPRDGNRYSAARTPPRFLLFCTQRLISTSTNANLHTRLYCGARQNRSLCFRFSAGAARFGDIRGPLCESTELQSKQQSRLKRMTQQHSVVRYACSISPHVVLGLLTNVSPPNLCLLGESQAAVVRISVLRRYGWA